MLEALYNLQVGMWKKGNYLTNQQVAIIIPTMSLSLVPSLLVPSKEPAFSGPHVSFVI